MGTWGGNPFDKPVPPVSVDPKEQQFRKTKDDLHNAFNMLGLLGDHHDGPNLEAVLNTEGRPWKQKHEDMVDKRYKELSREYHPDKWHRFGQKHHLPDEEAKRQLEEHYEKIKWAAEIIKDDIKVFKRTHTKPDQSLKDSLRPQWEDDGFEDGEGGSFDAPRNAPAPPPPSYDPDAPPKPAPPPPSYTALAPAIVAPPPQTGWGSQPVTSSPPAHTALGQRPPPLTGWGQQPVAPSPPQTGWGQPSPDPAPASGTRKNLI